MLALSLNEIQQYLSEELNNWTFDKTKTSIVRRFEFKNYYQTMAFVNAVAYIAHQNDHHPDLEVSYQQCLVSYATHDANGVTMKDIKNALDVDQLVNQ